jgi:uncharacterized protein DUF5329
VNARGLLAILILSVVPFAVPQAQPPPSVQIEVDYLLQRIEASGCSFYRNGSWYDGARAKTHLRTKYDYLVARNLIRTAEDFIDRAATKSSLSGQLYKIRCGTAPELESGKWLREVLARYRASNGSPGLIGPH